MAEKWSEAGAVFVRAAELNLKVGAGGTSDYYLVYAAANYVTAADCYKKSQPHGLRIVYGVALLSFLCQ